MMTRHDQVKFVGEVKRLMDEGNDMESIMEKTGKSKEFVRRAMRHVEIAKKKELVKN